MSQGGRSALGRFLFVVLLLCAIAGGAGAGLLFVYQSDLPQIYELEVYRPDVITELYSDDGRVIGSFALQRRILLQYDQIPQVLKEAILVIEDQHFERHWGVDVPRVFQAAWRNLTQLRKAEGASTLTMQLAGLLFLDRTDKSFRRKLQETLLAIQIERHYSKEQILTMYCNQIYLGHGNYGFEAAAQFYFGKSVHQLALHEAALLAAIIRGPRYSPLLHPDRALARRNLVLRRMAEEGKIKPEMAHAASQKPLDLRVESARDELAPYFVEAVRQDLERKYGTEAVHERGLRVYTTLNAEMQRAANRALRDGLHAYERRRGWRGGLVNILEEKLGSLEQYRHEDWRRPLSVGDYVTALVMEVGPRFASLRIGQYRVRLTPEGMAWTGRRDPRQLLKVGDLATVRIVALEGQQAQVELEQKPRVQGALVAIENTTGAVKAMVGGYSFAESKFNRATQALRQAGSSFKPYVYVAALEQGYTPFDTIVDEPFTTIVGNTTYAPQNYDERYEGRITLRRALAGSRNVPAVKLAAQVGVENVVHTARKFGISTPLPAYLSLALGAAEMLLLEHTSAFTVFPNDGVRLEPFLIQRVTTYEGAPLEEARPVAHDVIQPDIARTMVALLRDVVELGTARRARELGRPVAGKTGTTNKYTDAWFLGFTPSLTAGVWVGYDDPAISLGRGETGARAALPIWLQFMKDVCAGKPIEEFPNVVPLSTLALAHPVQVDTPDHVPADAETPAAQPGHPPTGSPPP
ncbi:MAG: PBP1A family penicillin-binding protein [Firmicutes bacterium]|nr:PBP1A family penicillin-binding protein [Bacillota bacterium]